MALTLANPKRRMILHYGSSAGDAKKLKKEVEAQGSEVHLLQYDFSKIVRVSTAVTDCIKKINKIGWPVDVLINNASIYEPTKLSSTSSQDWKRIHGINLEFPFLLAADLGLKMKKRKKGVIVNLTDIAGDNPFPGYSIYSISKAGLIAATKALAIELAPEVRVNAVSPGPILPPAGAKPAVLKKIREKTLLKRFGNPKDVALAVQFLVENRYITGEVIAVDGGKSLNS